MRLWVTCRRAEVFALLLLVPVPALADCPAAGATFRLATDPSGAQGEMRLEADPGLMTGMALVLSLPNEAPVRFEMIQSQGYGSTSVWPQAGPLFPDPEEEGFALAVFADKDGRLVPYSDSLPFADSQAPAALYVTGLGSALWYAATARDTRIVIDQALWYRDRCGE